VVEQTGIVPHVPVGDGPIVGDDPGGKARKRARRRSKFKGYGLSQRIRKRIEEIFGWSKTIGGLARARFVGRWKIKLPSEITGAAYNLLRLTRLRPAV
jgi:hypothetical protein